MTLGLGLGLDKAGGRYGGPALALGSVIQQTEGNSGTKTFTFPCICTGGKGVVTVDWAVVPAANDPADAADFSGGVLPSGSLSFGLTDLVKNIVVSVVGDTTWEPDEGFYVELSNAVGARILIKRATGGILNDDNPPAPLNAGLPAIVSDGSPMDGETLSVTPGIWSPYPVASRSYQWKRSGAAVSGATGTTYTLTAADVGATITVTETATNAGGSTAATSAGVGPVAALPSSDLNAILREDGGYLLREDGSRFTREAA